MSEPDFPPAPDRLSGSRIAILGLGLMGGSLALALRGRCARLLGVDPDPRALELARSRRVVDRADADPARILPEADLVILAAPVRAILELLEELPRLHPGRPVVMDLGSTKTAVVRALAALPERFDPLGGHPMCGREASGLENADGSLYQGSIFAFVSLPRTSQRAGRLAEGLARALGAMPFWVDAETHDQWVAATSHLPYLLAAALSLATPLEARALAGPGFRSAARLAGSSPNVMLDILATNRGPVLRALKRLRGRLDRLEDALAREEWVALADLLSRARGRQREIFSTREPER